MIPLNELSFRLYVEGYRDASHSRSQNPTNMLAPDYVEGYQDASKARQANIIRVAKKYEIDIFELAKRDAQSLASKD